MEFKWVRELITRMGEEDPFRPGLEDTPYRYATALKEMFAGQCSEEFLDRGVTVFDSEGYDQMILLKKTEFYSTCEHHLQPFFGQAHIAYIPGDKIIGISKLARILDHFSKRLQNQERITGQVADYIMEKLSPRGVGVILEAEHLCMRARGIQKQNSTMVTSALRGVFMQAEVRQEFLELIKL